MCIRDRHNDSVSEQASRRLWNAILEVLTKKKALTRDLGGESTTTEVAEAVIEEIDRENRAKAIQPPVRRIPLPGIL